MVVLQGFQFIDRSGRRTRDDTGRMGMKLRDGMLTARTGASLARVSQNEPGDGFALFLRKAGGVDVDLH